MILTDSREKTDKIKHITNYFDKHNIPYDRTKLYVGDYMRADNALVVIDIKFRSIVWDIMFIEVVCYMFYLVSFLTAVRQNHISTP